MPKFEKIKLTLRTVRYMTARQWAYRLYYTMKGKLPAGSLRPKAVEDPVSIGGYYENGIGADVAAADALLALTFPTASGQSVHFENQVDWDMPGERYRLKCFNLNSFSWLQILSDACRQTGNPAYVDFGLEQIRHWQASCRKVKGDKWNAYVLAKRLMHQIGFLCAHAEDHLQEFVPFLAAQADILSKNVEFHLGANHVLSEARALMFCGAFLKNKKLYRRGKRILDREFSVQFLADGGHYERSVSYHVESLQQYFEAVWLMARVGDGDAVSWAQRLREPYRYLSAMVRCDGTIPLVNDAARDYPFDGADFLYTSSYLYAEPAPKAAAGDYSRRWAMDSLGLETDWRCPALFADTGFLSDHFTFGNTAHSLFFHVGNHGPDCNLGHTHADSLSLLWTSTDGELFADSGVYTYAPGPERNACRATASHNTVEVDGTDSCECWAAFRVARRGHTRIEEFTDDDEKLLLSASHDGYEILLSDPVKHTRTLHRCKASGLITVTDVLTPKAQQHTGTLRFHLAPDCAALPIGDRSVLLRGKYLLSCDRPITLEKCSIAGHFGRPEESLCITARFPINGKTTVRCTVATEAV